MTGINIHNLQKFCTFNSVLTALQQIIKLRFNANSIISLDLMYEEFPEVSSALTFEEAIVRL